MVPGKLRGTDCQHSMFPGKTHQLVHNRCKSLLVEKDLLEKLCETGVANFSTVDFLKSS